VASGVLFSVLAAVALISGNVMQKRALGGLPQITVGRVGHLVRTLATSRLWMIGFVVCLVGVGLQVVAYSLAPLAVVQTIFNASIVLLIVLSRMRLGERLVRIEWTGLLVVVASVALISTTLGSSVSEHRDSESGVALGVALGVTLVCGALVVWRMRTAGQGGALRFGVAAGLLYGAAALGTKGASTLVDHRGLVASIPSIATSVYPYVFIAFSAVGMLVYQMGIQRFRMAIVGAMSDVVCSTYVVAVGTVVFDEALPRDSAMLALRVGGFAGVVVGTFLVASGGRSGRAESVPSVGSDLGLGPVLAVEAPPWISGPSTGPVQVPDLHELIRTGSLHDG